MKPIPMPVSAAVANILGRVWHDYFGGIERLSRRVSSNIEPLTGSPSATQVNEKLSEVIAALKAAELMDSE